MSINLDGTNGITSAGSVNVDVLKDKDSTGAPDFPNGISATGDVSIADKIVHIGDTNTAIRFPTDDTVTVETNGSERLRIDSAGNVGIGTSSPRSNTTLSLGRSVSLTLAGNTTATVATQSGGRKLYLVGVAQSNDTRRQSFGIWFAVGNIGGQYLELGNNDSNNAKDHTLASSGTSLEITNTSGSEVRFFITMICFG